MTRWRTRLFAPVLLAGLLAACTPVAPVVEPGAGASPASPVPALPDEDVVDLTVYFRDGNGEGAHLVAATREAPVEADLQRRALEFLIAGPDPDDGDLEPPLPTTTRVQDLRVEGQTAHVDLSAEVISDAEEVGANPQNEALALAALADTLTEFPEVEDVRLSVEGRTDGTIGGVGDVGAFWGGWGLPDVLVRDESVVEPEGDRDPVPDLSEFEEGPQSVGSVEAAPVDVRRVRTRDRTSYLRVVVELADAADDDETAAVPPVRASRTSEGIVLELRKVADHEEDKIRIEPEDLTFADVDADVERERLRVTVAAGAEHEFSLATLSSPVRVVLDIRK